ncbi:MAG: hypothetical protein JNK26_02240 [Candidatus Doudnabacteria bacterium]|nr:hypothetical protein [Candidatus Doudnabacteria bacterium]
MFAIHIQKPSPQRNLFFAVQLLVGLSLLIIARGIYFNYPYYQSYLNPQVMTVIGQLFWVLCGVWILDATRKYLFVEKLPVTTASLLFIYLFKVGAKLRATILRKKNEIDLRADKATRVAIMALVVKFFFFPIMMATVVTNGFALSTSWDMVIKGQANVNFDFIYGNTITLIFFIDTLIFAFGYVVESKWLGNQIRSVEPTMLGWVVALCTYPPFNSVTGTLLPLAKSGFAPLSPVLIYFLQLAILVCHIVFVLSSISLGTKATNLTNRGTVSRGTYRFVRHPAYTAKLTGWLLEGFLFITTPVYFLFWLGWVGIYTLRAWTEERHLSQDPDYVAYKKKVRWLCIPGII